MKYAKEGRSARRGLSRKINCLVMKDSLNVQDVQPGIQTSALESSIKLEAQNDIILLQNLFATINISIIDFPVAAGAGLSRKNA